MLGVLYIVKYIKLNNAMQEVYNQLYCRQPLRYIPFNNINMDFISGQKESSYHKNYLCNDFPGKQTAISFRL